MLGQVARLAVHQGQQDVQRILVTAFPFRQQLCDLIGRLRTHAGLVGVGNLCSERRRYPRPFRKSMQSQRSFLIHETLPKEANDAGFAGLSELISRHTTHPVHLVWRLLPSDGVSGNYSAPEVGFWEICSPPSPSFSIRQPILGTSERVTWEGCALLAQNIFSSCAICRMSAYSWSLAATNCVARRISKTG